MALEPTEEQLETLDHALYGDPPAREVWDMVRDMVLEAAERRLDAVESWDEAAFMGNAVIRVCDVHKAMEAIRAMKGKP